MSGCHAINGGGCINQHFTYTAAAGEVNDLTISTHSTGTFSSTYDVEDPGAVIVLSAAMTENPPGAEDPICNQISDHHVRCSALGNLASGAHTTVRLGDMDDQARVTPHVITAIFGDAGNDSISASGHVDDLHGGDGDDTVVTTDDAADDLFGDAGDDVLRTSQPLDRTEPDGGPGNDTFDFSNRSGNVTAIANNTDSGAGNTYPGIENFIGGAGDDTLTGDGGPNSLAGGAGDDTLSGLGGDDTFDPGPGPITAGPVTFSDDDAVNGGDGSRRSRHLQDPHRGPRDRCRRGRRRRGLRGGRQRRHDGGEHPRWDGRRRAHRERVQQRAQRLDRRGRARRFRRNRRRGQLRGARRPTSC